MERCGKTFNGEATGSGSLRCQRERGHTGAHLVDVDAAEVVKRYWWVPYTGESGVNIYQAGSQAYLAG